MRPERFQLPAVLGAAIMSLASGCSCTRRKHIDPLPETSMTIRPRAGTENAPNREPWLSCPHALSAARQGGTDSDRYVAPDERERSALADAITRLLSREGVDRKAASDSAAAAGFEVIDVAEIPGAVLVREMATRRRGGGAYMLRPGFPGKLVVQAPHTYFDEGTLPLSCELFQRAHAVALFIDTAHRYRAAAALDDGSFPADVAHARDSFFQAATRAALGARPAAVVVQLHGFATREGRGAIVVSPGEKTPGTSLTERASRELSRIFDKGVLRFPEDTSDLGATTNVQGAAVREAGGTFLHVEIAAELRRELLANPALRQRALTALASALEGA